MGIDWELAVTVLCATPEYTGGKAPISKEEYVEKFNKDAAKAGYNNASEYLKDMYAKDPVYLVTSARLYRECVTKHGTKNAICNGYKDFWMKCKAAQKA